jgi:Peptidase family C54
MLDDENCVGILGGRVNHAIYFVGYDSSGRLLGLDPHYVYVNPSMDTGQLFPRSVDVCQFPDVYLLEYRLLFNYSVVLL